MTTVPEFEDLVRIVQQQEQQVQETAPQGFRTCVICEEQPCDDDWDDLCLACREAGQDDYYAWGPSDVAEGNYDPD